MARCPFANWNPVNYLDGLEKRRTTRNLVRRLERLGYEVTLGPKAA